MFLPNILSQIFIVKCFTKSLLIRGLIRSSYLVNFITSVGLIRPPYLVNVISIMVK